jgi:anaerobic selenocysteine-containing dehydrogenase
LSKRVIERDALDRDFIARHCTASNPCADALSAASWADIEAASGLTRADIEDAARIYIDSKATIFCWGMGITQHRRSVATIQMLMNVLLLRGNVGKPGAGPCPVRGHSNVQGDRTMGIYEKPSTAFLDRLGAEFGFAPPRANGFDTIARDRSDARRARHGCSSRWAAISRRPRPIRSSPPRCALRADRAGQRPSSIARIWCMAARP